MNYLSSKPKSHLLFILVCIFLGIGFVLIKWTVGVFGSEGVVAWRGIVGGCALGIFWLLYHQSNPWPFGYRDIGALVMLAGFGYAIPWGLSSYVINHAQEFDIHSSSFVGMMTAFGPPIIVIIRIPLLGIYPTKRELIGVLGGLIFMGLLFRTELTHGMPITLVALGVISPVCFAWSQTYIKQRFSKVSAIALRMTLVFLAGIVLLPISRPDQIVIDERFFPAMLWLILLGVVTTGIGGAILFRLIQTRGPLYSGMVAYIIPSIAIIAGWFDGEQIDLLQILIMLGVFVMVALVQSSGTKFKTIN